MADFLLFKFHEGKEYRTLMGYSTALSSFYSTSVLCLPKQVFTNLYRSFKRDRAPALRTLPAWDLAVILESLKQHPYEPMSVAQLKYVTLKTVFLIALASARRRSEIHAMVLAGVKQSPRTCQFFSQKST